MTMIRWNPYREMTSLRQAMHRLFQDTFAENTAMVCSAVW